jgi:serine/threonine-protein kinase
MDFGLARNAGETGHTRTGALAGTPAFMAPEQARGEVRSLDRRTDVYCLGATLYDVLGGQPPFAAPSLAELLQRILHDEAPPLRRRVKDIPEDLDAIVLKCLEKEPLRRYESARALGEDLQRYLDGEPVSARHAALGYVLLKRARRHKWKLALAAAALAVVAVFVMLRINDRREAAEQSRLSRELGEDVKEMELFLRNAYGLPLHDIEREKSIIRARLKGIEERMTAAGGTGIGPGYYALGRGHLTLQDPKTALSYLQKASESGYSSPELDYAMGLALGDLYKKALEDTKRIEDKEQKKARIAAIDAEYKTPALQHLRGALGSRVEVSAYAEGLIAFYEGRHEEALAKAREAFNQAPWLYETKKLEGDIHFAEGSKWRYDASFNFEQMTGEFKKAEAAYREAANIARSDPSVHEAECELWIQSLYALRDRGVPVRPSYDAARAACGRAIDASPASGAGYTKLAFAKTAWANSIIAMDDLTDADSAIQDAIQQAEDAAKRNPNEAMAHYLVGSAWWIKAQHVIVNELSTGAPARESIERSAAGYEAALRLDATFLWAWTELCSIRDLEMIVEIELRGQPERLLAAVVETCGRAISLDAQFMTPHFIMAQSHTNFAEYLISRGIDPDSALQIVIKEAEIVRSLNQATPASIVHLYHAQEMRARFQVASGQDPTASHELAEKYANEIKNLFPLYPRVHTLIGGIHISRALYLLREGADPEPALRAARTALQASEEALARILLVRIHIIGLEWALKQGKPNAAMFDAAFEAALAQVKREEPRAGDYVALAEIHALKAEWLLSRRESASEDVAKGLPMAEKALSKTPREADALLTLGTLSLLQARGARDGTEGMEAARRAEKALLDAFQENPLLERKAKSKLAEAQRLARRE